MKTKKAAPTAVQVSHGLPEQTESFILKNAYLLQDDILLPLAADHVLSVTPAERKFKTARELEDLVYTNRKTLFGQHVFMTGQSTIGQLIFNKEYEPSGFLLDMSDPIKPRFFIIDIALNEENFYRNVLLKVTMFFSIMKREGSIDKLCDFIAKDKMIRKELQALMEPASIQSYLKNAITSHPNILLVIDSEAKELSILHEIYFEKWHTVKSMLMRKYGSKNSVICTVNPPFNQLINHKEKKKRENAPVSEEYHLEKTNDVIKNAYNSIKSELLKADSQLQFNPQKYYISLKKNKNVAFFHFSRKNISLVVMNPEKETRKSIKHYAVKTLTEKVQKFWNGPSCTIVIEDAFHLKEVTNLLKKLIIT